MSDELHREETLATLNHLKPGSSIAMTADFANENRNSICRIAIAWISGDDVYSVGFYVKPPTDDFSLSRKITPDMVAHSDCFADVWDHKVKPLLKTSVLSAYQSEKLFAGIKDSYEETGRPFAELQYFIRDLKEMAQTYLFELGNFSLPSIARKMNISVDLDSAVSRSMACVAAIDWLDAAFPNNNYGMPLPVLIARMNDPKPDQERATALAPEELPQPAPLKRTQRNLGLFILFCMIMVAIMVNYQAKILQENEQQEKENLKKSSQERAIPKFDQSMPYSMTRGSFIVVSDKDINSFMAAAQKHDQNSIRAMVRNDQVLVFADRTTVRVTGEAAANGFVPVTVTEGRFSGSSGYAPYNMVEETNN